MKKKVDLCYPPTESCPVHVFGQQAGKGEVNEGKPQGIPPNLYPDLQHHFWNNVLGIVHIA